jgi:hypothetical protein
MSELSKHNPESRSPLQEGDEDGCIEQHAGSDTGTTGLPDDGTSPPPPGPAPAHSPFRLE